MKCKGPITLLNVSDFIYIMQPEPQMENLNDDYADYVPMKSITRFIQSTVIKPDAEKIETEISMPPLQKIEPKASDTATDSDYVQMNLQTPPLEVRRLLPPQYLPLPPLPPLPRMPANRFIIPTAQNRVIPMRPQNHSQSIKNMSFCFLLVVISIIFTVLYHFSQLLKMYTVKDVYRE